MAINQYLLLRTNVYGADSAWWSFLLLEEDELKSYNTYDNFLFETVGNIHNFVISIDKLVEETV
jgi:hypothetical protein